MLNYISAELYKVRRRKSTWVLLFLLLICESIYILPSRWEFYQSMEHFITLFILGIPFALLLSSLTCSDMGRSGVLKNELSFGLDHTKIYLGKLLSSLVVSLAVLALVVVYYLGMSALLYQHADLERDRMGLLLVASHLGAALPLWIGALGLAQMLFFLVPNPGIVEVLYMCWFLMGDWLLSLLHWNGSLAVGRTIKFLQTLLLSRHLVQMGSVFTWGVLLHNWLLGLGWLVCTSAVGVAVFRRQKF